MTAVVAVIDASALVKVALPVRIPMWCGAS